MKLNLTKKFALVFAGLLIGVSLVLSVVSIRTSSDALMKETEHMTIQHADESAVRISVTMEKNLAVLLSLAEKTEVKTMDWATQKNAMTPEIEKLGYLDMAVVSREGIAQYVSNGETADLADRGYIQQALSGKNSVSDVLVSKVTGKPVLMEAVPIINDGQVTGALIGRRDGTNLLEQFGLVSDDKTYYFILGPDSTMFAHPDSELVSEQRNVLGDIEINGSLKNFGLALKETGLGKSGLAKYELDGEKRFTALAPISGTEWTLGAGSYEKVALQGISSLTHTLVILSVVVVLIGIGVSLIFSRRLSRPIIELRKTADRLVLGDVDVDVTTGLKDEIGALYESFGAMAGNIRQQAEAAAMIANGKLPQDIRPRSEKDILGISMCSVVDTLNRLAEESVSLTGAATAGDLGKRGETQNFEGIYRQIITGFNDTLDAVVNPLRIAAAHLSSISKGEIPDLITEDYKGDFNDIKESLNTCINAIRNLIEDISALSKAAVEGRLAVRADASRHGGDFAKIIEGINGTLDAVINPLYVAAEYIRQIGAGEIPSEITDSYYGDFNKIKNSINSCIQGLKGLEEASGVLEQMSVNDFTGAVQGSYTGIFLKIGQSLNQMRESLLDSIAVIHHVSEGKLDDLEKLKAAGKRSERDTLVPALVGLMENIKELVDETKLLSQAAIDGDLKKRGNVSKLNGEYANVIGGVNDTLDAVIEPVQEALLVLKEMADGNLRVSMEGSYKGEHEEIKTAMNLTIEHLKRYVDEISRVLSSVSTGSLNVDITGNYKGDFIVIKESLNDIISSLNQVFSNIGQAAEQVAEGSRQIADGSQSLSQGSAEQASSVEELSASITEISSMTKDNAASAVTANELAQTVINSAQDGSRQMKEMLEAMEKINESANNISRIIKVIDDIAFQTNILALNAAVEAARAGQHGKGFAVVAEEVRNLASRSAGAARETAEMILNSKEKSEKGTEIANHTAAAFGEIMNGVNKTAAIISEIAKSSNDQATGITQINTGLNMVSNVIQTTAATSEESAASSEELSGQAELLKEMIGRFQLKEGISYLPEEDRQKPLRIGNADSASNRGHIRASSIILSDYENDKY